MKLAIGSWLLGIISGACIAVGVTLITQNALYSREIDALKSDAEIQQVAARDEIESIRTQFSRALRLCNSKLEALKGVK